MGPSDGGELLGLRRSTSVGASEAGPKRIVASESLVPLPTSSRVGASDESGIVGADSSFVLPSGARVGLSESDLFGTLGSLIPCYNPGKNGGTSS